MFVFYISRLCHFLVNQHILSYGPYSKKKNSIILYNMEQCNTVVQVHLLVQLLMSQHFVVDFVVEVEAAA